MKTLLIINTLIVFIALLPFFTTSHHIDIHPTVQWAQTTFEDRYTEPVRLSVNKTSGDNYVCGKL
jgi:biopolymer transport protein ExbD